MRDKRNLTQGHAWVCMKRLLIYFLLCLICMGAEAQSRWFVAGGVSQINYRKASVIELAPVVGYNINSYWGIGMKASFETGDGDTKGVGAFVRWNFWRHDRFQVFTDGVAEFYFRDVDGGNGTSKKFAVQPGISYRVWKHLDIFMKYVSVGYDDRSLPINGSPEGNFRCDFSFNTIQLGVLIPF